MENKKYNIIYADPAWEYKDKASAGKRGACFKYPVMNIEQIKELKISEIADKDCVLFLWITMPKLNEVFDVIKSWGFEYKTCAFCWIKQSKHGKEFIGMGRWTRANAELCLLATKGKPQRINAGIRQLIQSPIREHSRKPDEVRNLIIKLCGNLPRIELFAREKKDGWDCFGNEVNSDIQLNSEGKFFSSQP
jgi:N6-adenosine-specific RNA methylase IME4